MKALITGGAGFIGYHLHKFLEKSYEVISIDNFFHPSKAPFDVTRADIRYPFSYATLVQWTDVVFHLAAQIHVDYSIHHPEENLDINVKGTLNILELCRKYNKRLVYASTSEVYGTAQAEYMDENHPLDAQSPYGASKLAGDRLCKAYADTYGLDVRILRNFNTFGEYQNDDSYGGVIAMFVRSALEGKPLKIYGDGTQERDYMYITDALRGYMLCAENNDLKGQVINIGTGKTISIKDLAVLIKTLCSSQSEIINIEPRQGEVMRLCAGIGKARSYGFKPQTDFKRDLEKYIDWYSSFKGGNYASSKPSPSGARHEVLAS